jgi:magnesium transporter
MVVNGFELTDALQLAPLDVDTIADVLQQPDARIWLDLQPDAPDEIEGWLDRLNVRDLTRRLCDEARDRPGLYPLKHEILLVVPALAKTAGGHEVDHVAFLCRERLLLTVHHQAVLNPRELAALHEAEAWLPDRSVAGLVSAMLIDLSLDCLRHATELRRKVHAVEERMDRTPDTIDADEILDLRAALVTAAAVVADQLPALQALSQTDKPFFKLKDAREYMNCALANLQAADGSLDRLDKRVEALRAGFQMHAQDKTNRRLNMLTVLSAIFLPITLLAGIWGMNFESMPELKYTYSYPVALGGMALIGAGMYLFFRKGGLID